MTKADVDAFWRSHSFDLGIHSDMGNCDLCFLKSQGKLQRIMSERPDLAAWWIEQERRTGQRFRKDRPSYEALLVRSQRANLPMMDDDEPDELSVACHCTD